MINGGAMWMHIAHAVAILIFCGLKNNFCVKMNHFYCFSLGKGSNIMIFEKEGIYYILQRSGHLKHIIRERSQNTSRCFQRF